jgi:replicative DNA helicase
MGTARLKPVHNNEQYRGAISGATNYRLEAELLGIPLWLQREGYEAAAQEVAAFIARQSRDLFVQHVHRMMWDAYQELTNRSVPLSESWIQQITQATEQWSDDESQHGMITPGLLDELTEGGSCKLTMQLSDSPMLLVREIVRELWSLYRRRQVIDAVEDLHREVTDWHPGNEMEIAEKIEELQREFSQRQSREDTASTLNNLIQADIAEIESGQEPERILTGFPSLDNLTGGFQPGNLVVPAARPAMGKTSLALDMSLNIANADYLTAYFSFEMTRKELAKRIVSKLCKIDVLRMRHGNLKDFQIDLYKNQFGKGCEIPLIIDDGNYTPTGIEARIREFNRMAHPAKVRFVVIDHLQLMGANDQTRYERRDRQLATYTGQLKDMAKRLDLIVLLLSQLNRQSANRPSDERLPRLSDLKESGSIEQDADLCVGLYRRYPDTQAAEDLNHADLVIMKNRSGPTGKISLTWVPNLAKFTDPNTDTEDPEKGINLDEF